MYRELLHTCFQVLFKPHIRSYLLWLQASLSLFSKGNRLSYETCLTSDCMLWGITDLASLNEGFSNCTPTSAVLRANQYHIVQLSLWLQLTQYSVTGLFTYFCIWKNQFFFFPLFLSLFLISFFLSFFISWPNRGIIVVLLVADNIYIVGLLPAAPWTLMWSWSASNWEKLLLLFLPNPFRTAKTTQFKPESSEPTKTV